MRIIKVVVLMIALTNTAFSQVKPALLPSDFVELQRGRCEGSCPIYAVRIYADGRIAWTGISGVRSPGKATARISANEATSLIREFRAKGFWDLRDEYPGGIDGPTAVVILHEGKAEKRVSDAGHAPTWLQILENRVDKAANTDKWIHESLPTSPIRTRPSSSRTLIKNIVREDNEPMSGTN
jgi:Domain of unknown function (DUF6438)